ncbi:MAG: bifunctional diaminohydroxyphosphoribosylaminopyrimidine deaminase/5-amino-6-(5-phosphoribosylamino)uracil reductase RibD [Eubacterium sp.]|nr:bifunctional diaminohydroxyphosphoribosylaminopyrimidine deaminase/5-amino-6-(5-phosphoribosylamino)uracil reductase RibD [Eubacterium sp.]
MNDSEYMKIALELAQRGWGFTAPNPMVGAVVVKDGEIIGQGWHEAYGEAHAEPRALAACSKNPRGATLYVTLEPCCHQGKQPPCVDAIIEAGIKRVVTGSGDPNPLVGGKGIQRLREAGILVTEGVLQEACDGLNAVFFHYIQTRRPFVTMKYAMTMDGKIAAHTGASQWVTGEAARRHVALSRHRHSAIMAGVGTVLADDPLLTCRLEGGKDPIRVICDTTLRTPLTARVVTTAPKTPTIIATCCQDRERHALYEAEGCQILVVPRKAEQVDLEQLMVLLGKMQIDSILLEGGGTLNWSALSCGVVQRVQAYIAPKLFGGRQAKTPVEGIGVDAPDMAFYLKNSRLQRLGEDFLIESEVVQDVHRDC